MPPANEYDIINVHYTGSSNWKSILTAELTKKSKDGWKPILASDSAGAFTIILERPVR